MAIQCPYCMHLMEVKGAKAGRFKPRCPSCQRKFALLVPENEHEAPLVEAIPQTVSRRDERLSGDITDALGIEKAAEPKQKPKPRSFDAFTVPRSHAL